MHLGKKRVKSNKNSSSCRQNLVLAENGLEAKTLSAHKPATRGHKTKLFFDKVIFSNYQYP